MSYDATSFSYGVFCLLHFLCVYVNYYHYYIHFPDQMASSREKNSREIVDLVLITHNMHRFFNF